MTTDQEHYQPKRWKPRLPLGELQGDFFFTHGAVTAAEGLLPSYRGADGDHEGILFLLGRHTGNTSIITTVLAPCADHGPGHVICTEGQFAHATRAAHDHRLGVLGQLHTHGRGWTEHSRGDDTLVLMPFDGMLSLIAPWYGHVGLRPLHTLGIHQHQGSQWVLIRPDSARQHLHLLPDSLDLR